MDSIGPESVVLAPRSAWGAAVPVEAVSLADVMSEELAKDLQKKENTEIWEDSSSLLTEAISVDVQQSVVDLDDATCSDDAVIAQMLQAEFDREHDDQIAREELLRNGSSKVSVSYTNYRRRPESYRYDSDDTDEDELDDMEKDVDSFEVTNVCRQKLSTIPKCGYKKCGDKVITKHDITMTNRRNACRVMEFPPGIETGDGGGFDMQLSNRVFNSLKSYSRSDSGRHQRVHDKVDKSTNELALDPKTRIILLKFLDNNLLDSINGVISTGKEALVLHAEGGSNEGRTNPIPSECVIKVFKTTLNEFKNRDKYIRDDYRFKERFSKQNPRKIIHMWAEKEMHNLKRMQSAGILCPEVVVLRKHILVMSFLGNERRPAPKLKDAVMSFDEYCYAYEQTLKNMKKLFTECNLVHADMSEYNILWHNQNCYFIDVSQSVLPTHPHALEFLFRDCTNISNFFRKKGVPSVLSPSEMFLEITGLKLDGSEVEALAQIEDYEENEELLTHGLTLKEFPFEAVWAESQKTKHTINKSTGKRSMSESDKMWKGIDYEDQELAK